MSTPLCLCNGAGHSQLPIWQILGSVRTNLGAGLLVATSACPALTERGTPRERHEDEYWVADSGATKNMTQDSSHLEDYTPVPPEDEVEGFFSLSQDTGAYDSCWTKVTAPSKGQRVS